MLRDTRLETLSADEVEHQLLEKGLPLLISHVPGADALGAPSAQACGPTEHSSDPSRAHPALVCAAQASQSSCAICPSDWAARLSDVLPAFAAWRNDGDVLTQLPEGSEPQARAPPPAALGGYRGRGWAMFPRAATEE
jgi:hypothetical protein